MYDTRDAAQNWEVEYTRFMKDAGFRQGRASPCVLCLPGMAMQVATMETSLHG